MSNPSGTSSQGISLPKGGGALHGIGETFSPDLHTGTGNFMVPLALPPGRNGFQPQLSLVYSTGNGNSPFGLGWSLSVPGVSRKTSKGIPLYDDAKDTFLLSGAEDLVPVPGGPPGAIRYRPRTEGLFAHIDHHRDTKNDYWQVSSKDGLVSLYGPSETASDDESIVANPTDRSQIFAWKLTSTTDPFDNRIEYLYKRDAIQTDGPHHWDQNYLSEIRYADYGDPASPAFLVTVRFTYKDRPDPFSDYRAGFEMRTVQRCTRIDIFTHAGTETLTRTYHLVYLDQQNLPVEPLPLNGVSLLSSLQVEGHDGPTSEWLPPLAFGYSRFEPDKRHFSPITGADMPPSSLANSGYELVDLFGNGLPDILEMNGTVRYWRNRGDGTFDLPHQMRDAPAGLSLADKGVQIIDANGDGRADLLVTTEAMAGYFPLRFGGLWDRRSFQRYRQAPSFDLKDPEVHLIDLDGDGVTDAVRSGSRLECFFNDPRDGWNHTRWVERRALEAFPNINFSDSRVKWADMTGDGLQDIVLVYDGLVQYWPNLGRGNWGKRITMRQNPRFPYGYDPKRILVGDVDGDGAADLVYVDDTRVTLWINQSGNGWSDPMAIVGTPPVTDMEAVRLVDLLGTGIAGVLWSSDVGSRSRASMFFLDFTGGSKPYLLQEMNNHLGAVTRVAYAPSTCFYLQDEQQSQTRWRTPLPFPVQVVAHVEVIDLLSQGKLTTVYRYHHGYWDGAEREFRGFGMVEQDDTETFALYKASGLHGEGVDFVPVEYAHFSPPTCTKTWFHQGPVGEEFGEWQEIDFSEEYWPGDPQVLNQTKTINEVLKGIGPRRVKRDALRALRGSILRTELYARDGSVREDRPYTITEYLYGLREESPADDEDQLHLFFPHPFAQRATQWERGDDPMTQSTFTGNYDPYGQPQSQITIAVPRRHDYRVALITGTPSEPYLATQTVTIYAQRDETERYIVDRVAGTTTFEIKNDGTPSLLILQQKIQEEAVDGLIVQDRSVIGQTLNFYDCDDSRSDKGAFLGLPYGQIGDYGALVRTESLVLTDALLQDAYGSDQPPYLVQSGGVVWPSDYPQGFQTDLPSLAGYTYQSGGAGSGYTAGYFVMTERRRYDFHDDPNGKGRGLVKAKRDSLGRDTTIAYGIPYDLLPTEVTAPVAVLKTHATYNYRVLQPDDVTDPNGNQTRFTFTPLGLLKDTWILGKTAREGDQQRPSITMEYDFLAFAERGQPISVRTIRQVYHDTEIDIPLPQQDETIEGREYSNGFGRLLQTRTQGEEVRFGNVIFGEDVLPKDQSDLQNTQKDVVGRKNSTAAMPNVVVSGWQIYDNKGHVVETYEPFFSEGWEYAPPTTAQYGQKVAMFYDPRGQVIRTLNPDSSEQRVIYGVPGTIAQPDVEKGEGDAFDPTPWEAYTYDANDNAGRTHADTATDYRHHWNTPTSIVIDALGRTVATVERNRAKPVQPADPLPPIEEYRTSSTYNIRGNLLTVTDALGRVAFKYLYDLANRPLQSESIDAGIRRMVLDAVGNVVERRDSKGALNLRTYDTLNRPTRLWARDSTNEPLTLREKLVYGDDSNAGLTPAQIAVGNLLGKLYQHYDEAGLLTFAVYDFKGNVLEKTRHVIADSAILAVFNPPPPDWKVLAFRVDWEPGNAPALASPEYTTTLTYDALNRVKTMQYPQDVSGTRKVLRPRYNKAGMLERVELDNETFVGRITYNTKGQRTLIAYGNDVMTRYAYDEQTFRLVRLRTEQCSTAVTLTYQPCGGLLQDLAYEYDLSGNITRIHDHMPESGLPAQPDQLDRAFTYDPLYRLFSATGRECDTAPPSPPWDDSLRCNDPTLTRPYTQNYTYDAVGNMTKLQHTSLNNSSFTRTFTHVANTNRLLNLAVGSTPYAYAYDANGNLIQENTERYFEWGDADRMRIFRVQTHVAGSLPSENRWAEPSEFVHYLYDASGQRVLKLVRKQGGDYEVVVYIDGIFEYHQWKEPGQPSTKQNNRLHLMDNQSRIAIWRIGDSDNQQPDIQYQLGDHLGCSNVLIGGATASDNGLINREEYFPYGETSFGSFARKRYRFTGKERDEESGLYYHGARYYAPWLGRWVSCDLKILEGFFDIKSGWLLLQLYDYALANPTNYHDPDGRSVVPNPEEIAKGIQTGIDKLTEYFTTDNSVAHSATRGTAEAVLTESQSLTNLRPLIGPPYNHGANLLSSANAVQAQITSVGEQLEELRQINPKAANEVGNALKPVLNASRAYVSTSRAILAGAEELRNTAPDALEDVNLLPKGRDEAGLISETLIGQGRDIVPEQFREQNRELMNTIESLHSKLADVMQEYKIALQMTTTVLARYLSSATSAASRFFGPAARYLSNIGTRVTVIFVLPYYDSYGRLYGTGEAPRDYVY